MAYFRAQFKGNLSKNQHEIDVLEAVFLSRTDRSRSVVEEIHDVKTPAFAAWAEEGDLCSACLDKLVSAHLHLWLLKRKVKGTNRSFGACISDYLLTGPALQRAGNRLRIAGTATIVTLRCATVLTPGRRT
jgi:hypothetical protein